MGAWCQVLRSQGLCRVLADSLLHLQRQQSSSAELYKARSDGFTPSVQYVALQGGDARLQHLLGSVSRLHKLAMSWRLLRLHIVYSQHHSTVFLCPHISWLVWIQSCCILQLVTPWRMLKATIPLSPWKRGLNLSSCQSCSTDHYLIKRGFPFGS